MAGKHTGLGRGLGELFQKTESDEKPEGLADGSYYAELPLEQIMPNPRQPRTVFDDDALDELVESIREVGVLQPIVVRTVGGDAYELIMGERRLRASRTAGLDTIPAIVRGTEDADLLRDALLENLHRADLNPLEEAAAYRQLLDDFDCTQEELARRIKRSRPQISNTMRLLKLPPSVQLKVAAGVLSAGHARALLSLDDPEAQEAMATKIIAEGLSVRGAEELIMVGVPKPRKARTQRAPSARALDLSSALSDHFDTRVKVSIGKHRGRIVIDFAGEEDLNRVLAIIENKAL